MRSRKVSCMLRPWSYSLISNMPRRTLAAEYESSDESTEHKKCNYSYDCFHGHDFSLIDEIAIEYRNSKLLAAQMINVNMSETPPWPGQRDCTASHSWNLCRPLLFQ